MVGWHHQLNGHGFEQTPENMNDKGSLACCSAWSCKELDMTERVNNSKFTMFLMKQEKTSGKMIFLIHNSISTENQYY